MNKSSVGRIDRKLTHLGYQNSGRIHKLLMNVEYNMKCAHCSLDLLGKIDPTLMENYSRISSGPQQAGSGGITLFFSDEKDVEFHTKRIVSDIYMHLKAVLDAIEETIRELYQDKSHIGQNGIYDVPNRSKLIKSISRARANLAISEFVRRHIQGNENRIRAMTFIRDQFIHYYYSVFNDLDRLSGQQIAESAYEFEAKLVFDRTGENLKVFADWPEEEREYVTFSKKCIETVDTIFDSFLNALYSDLDSARQVPIIFEAVSQSTNN